MTDLHDGRSAEQREELAYVCDQVERIRANLEAAHGAGGGAAPLERLMAALLDRVDLTAPLAALHEALLAAGDAAGIQGRVRGLSPIGIDSAAPEAWVLLCPTGQCSRYSWPDGPGARPCRISGRALRRERL
ncbi:hypothetical protein [Streptomyces sp. ISL-86]|uniref:hypothetical protein n=1 Tax=Streptomyces sp. ISL-86 TaxID=2819187 RepID=UPI001BE9F71F|nr:hypothetical protein [Streptomyces sp. ISL-86]MBT2458045.1 hypothetical protein [Streptomyces sp. ISL-86]